MEELIKKIQQNFKEHNINSIEQKIAFIIGYLEENDKVNKKQFIDVLRKINVGEL